MKGRLHGAMHRSGWRFRPCSEPPAQAPKVPWIELRVQSQVPRHADHPHIVDLKEVMASRDKIYMVMEFMPGGELFDKIVADGPLEVSPS